MRTPEQILDKLLISERNANSWTEFIREVQKEAYNQALQDSLDNVKIMYSIKDGYIDSSFIDPNSILKLKK